MRVCMEQNCVGECFWRVVETETVHVCISALYFHWLACGHLGKGTVCIMHILCLAYCNPPPPPTPPPFIYGVFAHAAVCVMCTSIRQVYNCLSRFTYLLSVSQSVYRQRKFGSPCAGQSWMAPNYLRIQIVLVLSVWCYMYHVSAYCAWCQELFQTGEHWGCTDHNIQLYTIPSAKCCNIRG